MFIIRLRALQREMEKEKKLREDTQSEIAKLQDQIRELGQQNMQSQRREAEIVRNVVQFEDSKVVSFQASMNTQVKGFVKHGQALYEMFEGVTLDPETLTFSHNDALFQAFSAEPDTTPEDAKEKAGKSVAKINKRLKRASTVPSDPEEKRKKRYGTFLPYTQLCRELLREKELEVFPQAVIHMSAHVLAPSPTFILALMCRLRQIATGQVNMVLIQCILGIQKSTEFHSYLSQLKEWNKRNQLCRDSVHRASKRKGMCGKRVNINKSQCSYHLCKAKKLKK
jgi:hypothetical protein